MKRSSDKPNTEGNASQKPGLQASGQDAQKMKAQVPPSKPQSPQAQPQKNQPQQPQQAEQQKQRQQVEQEIEPQQEDCSNAKQKQPQQQPQSQPQLQQQQKQVLPSVDELKGNWKQHVGAAKIAWGNLTEDEILKSEGKAQRLAGIVQERYAITRDEADKQVKSFFGKLKDTVD